MSKINRITIKDTSKHFKYQFGDKYIYTPNELYECQNNFIEYVLHCLDQKQNALVQSPTGTGKTISLLCSTLAWAMDLQQTTKKEPPQIIYASRTHAQLKQIVKQIDKLCYNIKLSILSSRDQACINEDLKLLKGQDKQLECRLRIAQKKGLSCQFYQNESYFQKEAQLGKLMDLQQISVKGKLEKFCPFFYQRFSKASANIVLIPYNYLFDKNIWSNEEGVKMQGSILILDEAHNIQSVCEQYREFSLSLSTLTRATQQLSNLRELKLNENKAKFDPASQKTKMLKIEMQDIELNASYIQQIFEYFQTIDLPSDSNGKTLSSKDFCNIIQKATYKGKTGSIFGNISKLCERFNVFKGDFMFQPYWALENWMKFVEKIQQLQKDVRQAISQLKVQILYEGSDIRINIICLDPSNGFKSVIEEQKPRSIILTSGTLSPLKMWSLQLKVQFAKPLSCRHVLSPKQTQTVILGIGRSGLPLDTRFENRKKQELYLDIGHALYEISRYTPNGIVALFPSYSFLEQTKSFLGSQKVLTKLYGVKNIYFQKKDSSDFASILERYMKDAQSQKGALLCALIRGKISQGLDFSHKKCRAVILVGVPYPCSKDVKVVSKINYLNSLNEINEKKSLSGTQWYLAQTVRAINQGIGRLIRSPDDFGSVYLIDERFSKPDIEEQLASWAKMNISKSSSFNQFIQKVKQINKIQEIPQDLKRVQEQFGLTSVRGASLNSQQITLPQKSIRQSISRPVISTTEKSSKEDKLTLKQLMSQIKQEKEINDEQKKHKKIEEALLVEQQQKKKLSYQRMLFKGKKPEIQLPPQKAKESCPICNIDAVMVKSNTCNHAACQECWDKWLTQDLRCPMCRGRVRRKFLIEDE